MLPLEKIVALIIFLIILIVLILFTDIPKILGGQVNTQTELRECCKAYIARGCPAPIPKNIICNSKNFETLAVEVGLVNITGNVDVNLTRDFCKCP